MAKITYENKVALNQNSSIPDINKVNDTDMNMIKNVVNNNETKVLLAVSSSAPATCDTGDMYFNTTDNLIYTATATNTWSSTGVAPTENTIYIEFTSQTLYAYDGTTLVSVGGGSGSEIVIGDEEPTEDTKMIIDTDAFDPQYSDITDEYSEANNKAYSCKYSNKAFGGTVLWTNPSPASDFASQNITLSSNDYRYLEVYFRTYKSDNHIKSVKIEKGQNALLDCFFRYNSQNYAGVRHINYVNDITLTVEVCYSIVANNVFINQADPSWLIPIKVIGYK
jgi:hypothetical protein